MPCPTPQSPPPTDKGWAWVVAVAIFFERFFTVGVTRSSGLFLLRLVDRYHVSTTCAGTVMTLALAIFAVGAPVATVIGESVTQRCVFIMGGLIAVGALTVAGLVIHLPVVIVMMGLAIGVINSCSYGNGMVMIGKYFREKRQMATNFAMLGASVGQLVVPPVVEYLIVTYGLSGALLISGALYLQCAVSGALLRPIDLSYQRMGDVNVPDGTTQRYQQKYANERDNIALEESRASDIEYSKVYKKIKPDNHRSSMETNSSLVFLKTHPSSNGDENSTSADNQREQDFTIPEIVIQNDKDEIFTLPQTDDWHNELYGGNRVNSRLTVESSKRKSEDSSSIKNGRRASFTGSTDKCIFTSGSSSLSTSGLELYLSDSADDETDDNKSVGEGSVISKRSRRRSSSIRSNTKNQLPPPDLISNSKSDQKCITFFHLVFDFSVLQNGVTMLFICITFLFYSVWYNFVFFLPGVGIEKGVTGYDAPILISMMGLGDLTARVVIATGSLFCYGTSFSTLQRYKLNAISAFLGGVNMILFIPASSFSQLVVFSFFHGMFGGMFECLFPGLLTDFVGVAKLAQTLGVVILFQGMGGAISQPVFGCLKDVNKSFHALCAACSGCLLTSCFLLLVYPVVRGRKS